MKLATSVLLLLLFINATAADTTRYVVVSTGKHTGIHKKWSEGHGHVGYFYEYNDRGRGPKITVNVKTGDDGMVVSRTAAMATSSQIGTTCVFMIPRGTCRGRRDHTRRRLPARVTASQGSRCHRSFASLWVRVGLLLHLRRQFRQTLAVGGDPEERRLRAFRLGPRRHLPGALRPLAVLMRSLHRHVPPLVPRPVSHGETMAAACAGQRAAR